MTHDNIVSLNTPAQDVLSEVLKTGAQQLLTQAIEAEVLALLAQHQSLVTESGLQGVVRNGYLPARTLQTGLGDIGVKIPKVRDRTGQGIKFNSGLVPPYLKRAKTIEELLPWLYLKGISTGDFCCGGWLLRWPWLLFCINPNGVHAYLLFSKKR